MTHVPRDTHVTKQRMAMRSNFPWSDFKKLGTPELSSSSSTSTALSPKNFEKRAHPSACTTPPSFKIPMQAGLVKGGHLLRGFGLRAHIWSIFSSLLPNHHNMLKTMPWGALLITCSLPSTYTKFYQNWIKIG